MYPITCDDKFLLLNLLIEFHKNFTLQHRLAFFNQYSTDDAGFRS
ncbi:MAG: hypothetical protein SFY68_13290 [Candidatus Sumerlaeia bacterium]|nr:hypothetical protein [Candidatus Sumerlaeia bacterium]